MIIEGLALHLQAVQKMGLTRPAGDSSAQCEGACEKIASSQAAALDMSYNPSALEAPLQLMHFWDDMASGWLGAGEKVIGIVY
jgi:hypothetical protein